MSAHISSIEQLEVLLLLRREAGRAWSGDAVARELRINPESARARLEDLDARGLLAREGPDEYRYSPRTGELDRAVAATARAYADLRVTVINHIFSKPVDKIRTFADAFKLKGDS